MIGQNTPKSYHNWAIVRELLRFTVYQFPTFKKDFASLLYCLKGALGKDLVQGFEHFSARGGH